MKKLPLTQGMETLVDDDIAERLSGYKLHALETREGVFYAQISWRGKPYLLHRLLIDCLPAETVDHINGDRLDNRRNNLRIATQGQNLQKGSYNPGKITGYRGVEKHPNSSRFSARIGAGKNRQYLGTFSSAEEAAKAYNKKAIELYGKHAYLNEV